MVSRPVSVGIDDLVHGPVFGEAGDEVGLGVVDPQIAEAFAALQLSGTGGEDLTVGRDLEQLALVVAQPQRISEPSRPTGGPADGHSGIDRARIGVEAEHLATVLVAHQPDIAATNHHPFDVATCGVGGADVAGYRCRSPGGRLAGRSPPRWCPRPRPWSGSHPRPGESPIRSRASRRCHRVAARRSTIPGEEEREGRPGSPLRMRRQRSARVGRRAVVSL